MARKPPHEENLQPVCHQARRAAGGQRRCKTWMSTLDYKVAFYDPTVDPVDSAVRGQKIYIFWHEYILFPLYLRGHCNLAMLLSRHRDADILLDVAHHLGFDSCAVRRRGGSTALRELLRKSRAHEPGDHARRPARPASRAGPGSDLSGVEAGHAAGGDGLWLRSPLAAEQLGRLPCPGPTRAPAAVVSPAIVIPPDLDRDGMEHYRLQVEQLLNRLTLRGRSLGRGRHAKGERSRRRWPAGLVPALERSAAGLRTQLTLPRRRSGARGVAAPMRERLCRRSADILRRAAHSA